MKTSNNQTQTNNQNEWVTTFETDALFETNKKPDWSLYKLEGDVSPPLKNLKSYFAKIVDIWIDNKKIKIKLDDGNIFVFDKDDKQIKYLAKYYNTDVNEFSELIEHSKLSLLSVFESNNIKVKVENIKGNLIPNIKKGIAEQNLMNIIQEIKENKSATVYSAKIVKLVNETFHCKILNVVECFMNVFEASPDLIEDPESYIGKEIPVVVTSVNGTNIYVSHKKYIDVTQKSSLESLKELVANRVKVKGIITGVNDIGVFVKNEKLIGLIYYNKLKRESFEQIKKGILSKGNEIEFYIDDVTPDGRCICTNMEITDFEEKAKEDLLNKTHSGKIINIKGNNAIVQIIAPDRTSYLTSVRNCDETMKRGDIVNVQIYSVFLDKENKIKTYGQIVK
jgi:predicted RNA-binding protein with RPS1 domain